jgi:hypothetical protein
MMARVRWQDWTIVALGCWLAASPWQMGFWLDKAATENACGLGAALVIFNLISACRLVDKGQEIFNILLGVWLILSPYALSFAEQSGGAAIDTLAVGVAIVALAFWQLRDATR